VFPRDVADEYGRALLAEIRAHEWRWRPETVYFGGGTPSQMPLSLLHEVLAEIPGRPWTESTIEAAPGSLTEERVRTWQQVGINRVSLGVQSFVAQELAKTGRKHDAETVDRDVALLRRFGITDINIDLIAGLAHQTVESWGISLDWVERHGVPHVSIYLLEVDEDSRLGFELLRGGTRYGAQNVPSGDLMADLYEAAVERLAATGVLRYEISNFAVPGHESRHNLKYWRLEPYVGFGADAHSFNGETRWANAETAVEYIDRWRAGRRPTLDTEAANHSEERFFVGLRLAEGIEPQENEWREFAEPIQRFVSMGLLVREGGRLRLSPQGVLLSNEVLQEFIHA
jgi:oxygen-independent coproporphyrinogen-3 oxidase